MVKRKVEQSDEESAAYSDDASSAEEPVAKSKKATKTQTIKKPVIQRDEDSESEEEEKPVAKKAKRESKKVAPAPAASGSSSSLAKVKTNKDGDKYIDLGKKKHATVRVFKGMPLLDIREFYGDEGDLKPGKKGISLTFDQWEILKNGVDELDELLQKVKK